MNRFRHTYFPLIEISIVVMVVLLPLANNPELMNGIQTAKSFNFFYFIMALTCLASLSLPFKKEKLKLNVTLIDVLFFAFVAWVSLNKYLLQDVHALSLCYFELLGLSILYIVLRSINQKFHTLLLVAICISGLVQAVYGNLQLWGYYPSHHGLFKMTGSFFNPGPFAGFLCCVLPVAVGLYWSLKDYTLQVSSLKGLMGKPFERFEASHLKGLKLTSFMFKRFGSEDSNTKYQTRSLEHEVSNKSNSLEQLRFVAIKYTALFTIIAILLVLPAARSRAAWLGAIAGVAFLAWHKYNLNQFFKPSNFSNLQTLHLFKQARQTAKQSNKSEANIKPSNGIAIKLFKRVITFRNKTIVAILALVLLAGSLSLYHYKKDSADGRMLIWTVTANIIKDYPLLGVGQDLFKAHYMNYQADYFRSHPNSKYKTVADDNQYAFNEFLNTWTENGLIGFLLLMGIVVAIFLSVINHKGHERIINHQGHKDHDEKYEVDESQLTIVNLNPEDITKASILAILVFGLFAYPSEILPIKIVAIICLGFLSNYYALNTSKLQTQSIKPVASNGFAFKPSNIQTLLKLTITGFVLLITVATYPKTNELRQAYRTWNDAFELYNYGLYTDCLEDYQKALPLLQHNGEYLINYGKALSISEKHTEAIEILEHAKSYQSNSILYTSLGNSQKTLKEYTNAEKNYWQASNMTPGKFYPQYLLAKLYDEMGQRQKAIEIATALLKKEVKVESTAIKEIHEEMEKIIERNTVSDFPFSSNKENTNNRQKGRNNQILLKSYTAKCLFDKKIPENMGVKKKGGSTIEILIIN